MTRTKAAWLPLLAAALWGFAFLFQKSAMSHVGPLTFIGARGVVASLALAPRHADPGCERAGASGAHVAVRNGAPGAARDGAAGGVTGAQKHTPERRQALGQIPVSPLSRPHAKTPASGTYAVTSAKQSGVHVVGARRHHDAASCHVVQCPSRRF
jgi:hypothetical protein